MHGVTNGRQVPFSPTGTFSSSAQPLRRPTASSTEKQRHLPVKPRTMEYNMYYEVKTNEYNEIKPQTNSFNAYRQLTPQTNSHTTYRQLKPHTNESNAYKELEQYGAQYDQPSSVYSRYDKPGTYGANSLYQRPPTAVHNSRYEQQQAVYESQYDQPLY